MKNSKYLWMLIITATLYSCYQEDPGPRQQDSRVFTQVDFDRLEIGDAMVVKVDRGNQFTVTAEGDRRNLDDLLVFKTGSSLVIKFNSNKNRHYNTFVNITMPTLKGINFSGAVNGQLNGFVGEDRMDFILSGASLAQANVMATQIYFNVSGASQLRLQGEGKKMDGTLSGASFLSAFEYGAEQATILVSGASNGKVAVSSALDVNASGASVLIYRGNPQLSVVTTGSSVVRKE